MKRSEINTIVKQGFDFIRGLNFKLPPFAFWTPDDWAKKGHEVDEIRTHNLGWDVTDLGMGCFKEHGLLLFTVRNGKLDSGDKPYAEKIMVSQENQSCGMHFHYKKVEDIINRGGGVLVIKLYLADKNAPDNFLAADVVFQSDGETKSVSAGGLVRLRPGESITLLPYVYHEFWSEEGTGPVMIGEVSAVNDDFTDNHFASDKVSARYPTIEEDEPRQYLLCTEYPKASSKA